MDSEIISTDELRYELNKSMTEVMELRQALKKAHHTLFRIYMDECGEGIHKAARIAADQIMDVLNRNPWK